MSTSCPLCKGASIVLRNDSGVRRRECSRCKHRWTTVEITKTDHERSQRIVERVREVAHDVLAEAGGG